MRSDITSYLSVLFGIFNMPAETTAIVATSMWDLIIPASAAVISPFLAIYANRKIDESKFKSNEKLNVFKTLMTSRANQCNVSFVDAINIIDVVFSDSSNIVSAKNTFVSHRCFDFTGKTEIEINNWQTEDKKNLNNVIKAIAKDLKISTEISDTTVFHPNWLDTMIQSQIDNQKLTSAVLAQTYLQTSQQNQP